MTNNAISKRSPFAYLFKEARMRNTRILILLLIPFFLFTAPSLARDSFTHQLMIWVGYVMVILCVLGRTFCSIFIGGKKTTILINMGPYSIVRNPLYVFSFIGVLGIGLQSGMWLFFIALALIYIFYYPHVVALEEEVLAEKFGIDFQQYMNTVPRWLPKFSLWQMPEVVETATGVVLKTMKDASLFFLAMPIFSILQELHVLGKLPVLFGVF